ncbi:MAG: carboxypeptidase regulatory-like domain-containing protein [Streptosporangiaceae bacterium]
MGASAATGTAVAAVATTVPARAAAARPPTLATARPAQGIVTGVVRGGGRPLVGVCVTATGPAGRSAAMTTTGGWYLLSGLTPGRYSFGYRDCAHPGSYLPGSFGAPGRPAAPVAGQPIAGGPATMLIAGGHVTTLPTVTLEPTWTAGAADRSRGTAPARPLRAAAPRRLTVAQLRARYPSAGVGGLSGRVTSTAGRPLGGICVMVNFPDGYIGVSTARNGTYNTGKIFPGGRYTVQFASSCGIGTPSVGNWAPQWYRDAYRQSRATPVVIRAGRITTGIGAVLRPGGQITGTVTGRAGARLTGVCVGLARPGSNSFAAQMRTRRGGYRIASLDPGGYQVYFDPSCARNSAGYLPRWWPAAASRKAARQVRVGFGAVTKGIDTTLPQGGKITGTVRFGRKTGRPLAGICVYVSGTGHNASDFASGRTGRLGRYVVSGLPPGRYQVDFTTGCGNNGNYIYLTYPRLVRARVNQTTGNIDAYLKPGGIVSGTVTAAATGQPLRGICVSIGNIGYGGVTGKNGQYTVDQLPPGRYQVSFTGGCGNAGSYAPQYFPGRVYAANGARVRVRGGHVTGSVDASMKPGSAIGGSVTSAAGRNLSGVCVSAVNPGTSAGLGSSALFGGPAFAGTIATSTNGSYQIANLAAGSYQVAFFTCDGNRNYAQQWFRAQPGYGTAALVNVPPEGLVTGISAVLTLGGVITGSVRNRVGGSPSFICVVATNVATGAAGTSLTFPGETAYIIGGLAPGRYTIEFADCGGTGYATQWYRLRTTARSADLVTVRAGGTTGPISAVLTTIGGTISGRVTAAATGAPLRHICATASTAGEDTIQYGETNARGYYTITGLDPGSYRVTFGECYGFRYAAQGHRGMVRLGSRQRVRGVNAALAVGGAITGQVRGGTRAVDQPGICVDAIPVTGSGVEGLGATGVGGRYRIGSLAPGTYRVYFGDPACPGGVTGLAPQWYSGRYTEAKATIINVAAGQVRSGIGAHLLPDGSITGTVTGPAPSAGPLTGVCVLAVPLTAGRFPVYAATADGGYVVPGLAPGRYLVEFSAGCGASGYRTQWWDNAGSRAHATVITVSADHATTGIDAAMRP